VGKTEDYDLLSGPEEPSVNLAVKERQEAE